MSFTILEKTRVLHEDIERYERAIEGELELNPKTVRGSAIFIIYSKRRRRSNYTISTNTWRSFKKTLVKL